MDLFIMTTKLTKTKAVAGVLAGGVLLCAVIFTAGHAFEKNTGGPPSPASVSDNAQRVAYLAGWGWEVEPSAVETLDLTFPETLDEAYLSYNELQMENGMDLTPYCGQQAKRYTYRVSNYPDYEGTVLAITPILGLIKPLASLGQRTLPIYILHMPLYALLVQLGCYEACASHGLPAVITWLCFIIPAVVALCASAPVCAILNGIANIWYKTLPALFSRRG